MKPVSRRDLVVLAVGLAVVAWVLVRAFYSSLPPLSWWLPLPLGVVAVGEALGARALRARLAAEREARSGHRADAGRGATAARPELRLQPVEPLLVARVAVLAQASAWVGAAFAGLWTGALVHVAPAVGTLVSAPRDTVGSALGLVLSLALVLAALWLEAVCRVPPEER